MGLCKFKVSLPIYQALIEMNPHLKQTNEQKKTTLWYENCQFSLLLLVNNFIHHH